MTSASPRPGLRVVAFALAEMRLGIRLGAVECVLPMAAITPLPQAPPIALGVINLHGTILPVLDIRQRFSLPFRQPDVNDQLLVAYSARRTVVLPVDEVLGVREIPDDAVTPPGTVLPGIGYLAGIVATGDGLLYIHDLDSFLALDEERQLQQALHAMEAE
jgi:purine-binding chemotaxis protein CheW